MNDRRHEVDADPETPLLYVLRNDLGLVAARFGCGLGLCGSCFVLVDGHPMASCDMPLWSAVDKRVVTAEGLADPVGPAVKEAFLAEQAAQCGYCTTGMVVSAVALLSANPNPTEVDVKVALDRNLCRCGVQNRVVRAVLRAARSLSENTDDG